MENILILIIVVFAVYIGWETYRCFATALAAHRRFKQMEDELRRLRSKEDV